MTICLCCLTSRLSHWLFKLAAWLEEDAAAAVGRMAEGVADWGSERCR